MSISWNHLSLKVKKLIVSKLDPVSRAKLSICSKSDKDLVHNTDGTAQLIELTRNHFKIIYKFNDKTKGGLGFFVKLRDDGGSILSHFLASERGIEKEYILECPNEAARRTTIINIMKVMGKNISVDTLKMVAIDEKFKDFFTWFRAKIQVQPVNVSFYVKSAESFDSIDALIDWPSDVKVKLHVRNYNIPIFERLNTYDNIVEFSFDNSSGEVNMTDEKLKKLTNASDIRLNECPITVNGFHLWLKKWLNQESGDKCYIFYLKFRKGLSFRVEDIVKGFEDVIERKREGSNHSGTFWRAEIRKNENEEGILELRDDTLVFKAEKGIQNCEKMIGLVRMSSMYSFRSRK